MAYEVIVLCHLHMPLYFRGTFTEYPFLNLVFRHPITPRLDSMPKLRTMNMAHTTSSHVPVAPDNRHASHPSSRYIDE